MIKMHSEKKSFLKDLIRTYIAGILSFYADLARRKIRNYATVFIVATASMTVILYGAGALLGSFFPEWRAGMSHILAGAFALLVMWMYGRTKK